MMPSNSKEKMSSATYLVGMEISKSMFKQTDIAITGKGNDDLHWRKPNSHLSKDSGTGRIYEFK